MKLKLMFAVMMLTCSTVWASDLTITTKTSGQVKGLSTSYITSSAMRTNSPALGFDVITDFQKGITYVINHKAKTITFTKLADLPAFTAFVAAHTPSGKGMEAFSAGMNDLYGDPAVFKVENTGREIIAGHACNKTRITSGNLVWEFSMDPALHSPIDAATMSRFEKSKYASLASHPKMAKVINNMTDATAKLNGFAMKIRMTGYNGETDSEVTSVSQAAIPASMFVLPSGYTMKDQLAESEKAMARHH